LENKKEIGKGELNAAGKMFKVDERGEVKSNVDFYIKLNIQKGRESSQGTVPPFMVSERRFLLVCLKVT